MSIHVNPYPETRRGDLVEDLHGHQVADPYRWLEDPDSVETKDWVERQSAFTEAYLAQLPDRDWFRTTLRSVVERPRAGYPTKKGGWYFLARNDGTKPQDTWYVAKTLDELESGGGRVILDPSTWSDDGTSSLNSFSVSGDGRYLAYARSDGGSDWQHIRLLEVATGEPVEDVEVVTKFSYPRWLPDNRSFLYHRIQTSGQAVGTDTTSLPPRDLMIHKIGRDLADDVCVWVNDGDPMTFTSGDVSHDDRWFFLYTGWGTERANTLRVHPITTNADGDSEIGEGVDVVGERTDQVWVVRSDGDELILQTDRDAPLDRVVRAKIEANAAFADLIPEGAHALSGVAAMGDCLLVEQLVDVTPELHRYALDGTPLGRLDVSGGAVVGSYAEAGDPEAFVGMSSVVSPTQAYAVDADTGSVRKLDLVRGRGSFEAPEIVTERRRAASKDGTEIPYWLIYPRGTDLSQPRPTLVYGYGGFSIPVLADYRPGWSGWLAAGGVLVITNLRGGSEFGRAWYDAGRLAHKQNVFDDVAAVGDDLVRTGVSSPEHLVVHGRSNGGLLAGAALTQRPELWKVALPVVGVLDVLRFHLFTGGKAWASDYGNPEVAEDFEVALRYSPVHNVREGAHYPATLIATGDHDDRVVPLHSHKFAAHLQRAQAGDAPVLTRIERSTGHGMGKPARMLADEWADLLAFAAYHTGLHPDRG